MNPDEKPKVATPDVRTHVHPAHRPAERMSKYASGHHRFTQHRGRLPKKGALSRTPGYQIPRIKIEVGKVSFQSGSMTVTPPAA